MKRTLFAIGAALAIAIAVPSAAGAAPHGHHGHWGGHGGGFHHFHGGSGITLGFGAPYAAYNSCYDVRPVWRHGHRVWRRIWVC